MSDRPAAHLTRPDVTHPWRDAAQLLRHPAVGRLVTARFVSLVGAAAAPIALAFGVLAVPGARPVDLGLVLAATALSRAVFLLAGGVVADRMGRRRLMIVAEVGAGLSSVVMALALATGAGGIPALAALGALAGLSQALFFPAFTGFVPEVAAGEDLQPVNALLRLANNLATVLGAALGGALVALVGSAAALVVSGGAFVAAAALVAGVRPRRRGDARTARVEQAGLLGDLVGGWRVFTARRWAVVVVALGAVTNIGVGAALGVLGPVRATQSLGGAGAWAVVTAGYALGTLPGVLLVLRLHPRRPLAVAVGAGAGPALPIVGLAVPLPLPVIALLAVIGGLCLDVLVVLWDTTLQSAVPPEALSRVSAFDWFGTFGLAPLSLALAGPLVDAVGLSAALWIAAVLAGSFPLALLDPAVRRLPPGGP